MTTFPLLVVMLTAPDIQGGVALNAARWCWFGIIESTPGLVPRTSEKELATHPLRPCLRVHQPATDTLPRGTTPREPHFKWNALGVGFSSERRSRRIGIRKPPVVIVTIDRVPWPWPTSNPSAVRLLFMTTCRIGFGRGLTPILIILGRQRRAWRQPVRPPRRLPQPRSGPAPRAATAACDTSAQMFCPPMARVADDTTFTLVVAANPDACPPNTRFPYRVVGHFGRSESWP